MPTSITPYSLYTVHFFLLSVLHEVHTCLPILWTLASVGLLQPVMFNLSMSADSCSWAFAYLCRHACFVP
ncbi:MAG: hypothetical protein IKU02_08400 [Bacteroidaceae bacterium]|nr:hypothetical protein [Bacteroidaceae bacterium]